MSAWWGFGGAGVCIFDEFCTRGFFAVNLRRGDD